MLNEQQKSVHTIKENTLDDIEMSMSRHIGQPQYYKGIKRQNSYK